MVNALQNSPYRVLSVPMIPRDSKSQKVCSKSPRLPCLLWTGTASILSTWMVHIARFEHWVVPLVGAGPDSTQPSNVLMATGPSTPQWVLPVATCSSQSQPRCLHELRMTISSVGEIEDYDVLEGILSEHDWLTWKWIADLGQGKLCQLLLTAISHCNVAFDKDTIVRLLLVRT